MQQCVVLSGTLPADTALAFTGGKVIAEAVDAQACFLGGGVPLVRGHRKEHDALVSVVA
jgi:hypothetical protein